MAKLRGGAARRLVQWVCCCVPSFVKEITFAVHLPIPGSLSPSFSSCVLAEGASEAKITEYKRTQLKLTLALIFAFLFMVRG